MSRIEELTTQTRQLLTQVRDLAERSQTVMVGLRQVLAALEELRQTPETVATPPRRATELPSFVGLDVPDAGDLPAFAPPTPEEALAAFGVLPTEIRPASLPDGKESPWERRKHESRKEGAVRKTRLSSADTAVPEKPVIRRPSPTHQGASRAPADMPVRERRQSARRAGNIVSVQVRRGAGELLSGWILDRSIGGLGLLMDEEIAVDTALYVRPTAASEDTPWIKAEARYSVSMGGSYRLGCRFVNNPTWQQLRVFG